MRFQVCLQYVTERGMALRHWVHFQGVLVHSLLDLLSWDSEELKAVPTQQVYHQDDQGNTFISGPTKSNNYVGS